PAAAEIHYPLALAYRELGREEDAARELARVGEGEARTPDPVIQHLRGLATGSSVHTVRGRIALESGDLERAAAEFTAARDADPRNPVARRGLALALDRSGDSEGAARELAAAAGLEPANPLNLKELGLVRLRAGAYAEAVESFERALGLAPDFVDAEQGLGIALARLGRTDQALPHLTRAVEAAPANAALREERALALMRLGRRGEARVELDAAIEADPDSSSARLNLGLLLELEGDLEAASAAVEGALARAREPRQQALAHLTLGRLAERGAAPEALAHYREAIRLDPDLVPARVRLGSLAAAAGDPETADAAYREALRRAPGHLGVRLALAATRLGAGDCGGARETLESAPGATRAPQVAATLGLILSGCPGLGAAERARGLELARGAYGASPGVVTGHVLAIALAAAGHWEEAVRATERLLGATADAGLDAGAAGRRLEAFRSRRAVETPWLDDPALLPARTVALPRGAE
ncbi:MAG TPA: tetratricopeptide repeat protein, partial [Thermoanaerobaculia bacterium]|nr:tetratricopeptide repeat protein [Thermoanaerobaculia bacterium]